VTTEKSFLTKKIDKTSRKKGFVTATKSFVKIGTTKNILLHQNVYFYQQNVWLLQHNFWLKQQKNSFLVPNFVAVTKPFFSV